MIAREAHNSSELYQAKLVFCTVEVEWKPGVAYPRAETVKLTAEALDQLKLTRKPHSHLRIVDLCTGTGCIACAVANAYKNAEIVAVDKNKTACDLASKNVINNGFQERVIVLQADIREELMQLEENRFDMVIVNPPYTATKKLLDTKNEYALAMEGHDAFDGGDDGLGVYACAEVRARRLLQSGGIFIAELRRELAAEAKSRIIHQSYWSDVCVKAIDDNKRAVICKRTARL